MAELDKANTDHNLKQHLHELGVDDCWRAGEKYLLMQTIMKTMLIVAMMMMAMMAMMAMMRLRTWPEEGRRMPTLARVRRAGGREINLVMMRMIREATAAVYKITVMIIMMMIMTIERWGVEVEDSALLIL